VGAAAEGKSSGTQLAEVEEERMEHLPPGRLYMAVLGQNQSVGVELVGRNYLAAGLEID